jgi:hypothetical protein
MDVLLPIIQRIQADVDDNGVVQDGSQLIGAAIMAYIMSSFNSPDEALLREAEFWIGSRGALMFPDRADQLLSEAKEFCLSYAQTRNNAAGPTGSAVDSDVDALSIVFATVKKEKVTVDTLNQFLQDLGRVNQRISRDYFIVVQLMVLCNFFSKTVARRYVMMKRNDPKTSPAVYLKMAYKKILPHAPVAKIEELVTAWEQEFNTVEREARESFERRVAENQEHLKAIRESQIRDTISAICKKI